MGGAKSSGGAVCVSTGAGPVGPGDCCEPPHDADDPSVASDANGVATTATKARAMRAVREDVERAFTQATIAEARSACRFATPTLVRTPQCTGGKRSGC